MCVACLTLARDLAGGGGFDALAPEYALNADVRGSVGTASGKVSYTSAQAIQALTRSGATWSAPYEGTTVTYAYRSTAPANMPSDTTGFTRFTPAQINAAELAFAAWSDVANIVFSRVAPIGYSDQATILLANYANGSEGAAAFAYMPGQRLAGASSGDVWVSSAISYNRSPSLANYGQQVLLHEIGHAIGLSHPASYNASADDDITYANSAVYFEDSRQYTVMSYFNEANTGGSFGGRYAAAPMLDDIAAVQALYGANMATRAGDTVYGFGSTAERPWFEATETLPPIFAVWDGGGTDTLDFSGYSVAQSIDLREGHFSDVGGLIGNVAVAHGVVVENAFGGSGADVLIGNAAGNVLQGRGGADTLIGLGGDDVLVAGEPGLEGALDVLKSAGLKNDNQARAVSLDGAFDRDPSSVVQQAADVPHATVRAVSHGGVEWYAFTAAAGAEVTLDIDGATFDSQIYVYGPGGVLIESNDDAPSLDPGSPAVQDSRLTITVPTAGVYYVAVNVWSDGAVGAGPPPGATYTLHVSVSSATVAPSTLRGSLLDGGAGADMLVGGSGADRLFGGEGADTLDGLEGDDIAYGAQGADLLRGGDGRDLLNGEMADDRLFGEAGDDTLSGELGRDQLWGGAGSDLVLGGADDDVLFGEAGEDVMFGEAGADLLLGGADFDIVNGMDGDDVLQGELGVDVLSGELGADVLYGGLGADILIGGGGADRFVVAALGDSQFGDGGDLIVDFQKGLDVIDLAGVDADSFAAGDQAFAWVGAFTSVAGQATLTYDASLGRTVFRGDVNGDGQADVVLSLLGQVGQADGWVL